MKQTVLLNLLLLVSTSLFAQVGIGTTSPKAMLDVASPTSGMLIPRYPTLADANTNSLPTLNATDHKGMMIYVIEESNKGFWFYDGLAFVRVGARTSALPIVNGGTGATTAGSALNALLPAQNNNANKVLTSDGASASWQKPAGRIRSIFLGVGDFDIIPDAPILPPTKQWLSRSLVIAFADQTKQSLPILVPIPANWNGTSPFALTAFYCSTATTGSFFITVEANFLNLNSTVLVRENACELPNVYAASSGAYGLKQFTLPLCGPYSPSIKFMELYITRNGSSDQIDTATGNFNLLAIRIDYQD